MVHRELSHHPLAPSRRPTTAAQPVKSAAHKRCRRAPTRPDIFTSLAIARRALAGSVPAGHQHDQNRSGSTPSQADTHGYDLQRPRIWKQNRARCEKRSRWLTAPIRSGSTGP
eukprot:983376-Rhodomonas_salina.1